MGVYSITTCALVYVELWFACPAWVMTDACGVAICVQTAVMPSLLYRQGGMFIRMLEMSA